MYNGEFWPANALRQANVEIQRAIQYLQNQQWMLMLTLRQELQQHIRQFGDWPSLDEQDRHGGWQFSFPRSTCDPLQNDRHTLWPYP